MLRGSEWGRWDLHVHTKNTAKNDQFKSTDMDAFCEILFRKAIKDDIKAIGITDYFSIRNYKEVKEYQESIDRNNLFQSDEKEKIKNIFLIPNIELRMLPSTDKGSLINIHLLLNPDCITQFENDWSSRFTFQHSTKTYHMTEYGLKELGIHMENNPQMSNDKALKAGIQYFALSPETINQALGDKDFRNNVIVVLSNSNQDGASSFQKHESNYKNCNASLDAVRTSIYQLADAMFTSNPSDRYFFLARCINISPSEYEKRYGSLKPCIHGSDAHSEDKLFEPDQQRYCWIKADPTFEGLKQILYEPESRVHIGATVPEFKNDYEVIDHIKLDNNDVFNKEIYFNQNLTTIIGGRSSGKSTLLQCLAKKLNKPLSGNEESENELSHIEELSSNLQIIWKDGKEDNSRRVEYFYQGHMYQKSTNKGIEDIIKDILLQQKTDIFDKYDEAIANIKISNTTNLTEYSNAKEKIKALNQSLEKLGNYKDVLSQIAKLNEQINQLNLSELNENDLG
ncbi:ATPase, partial [Pasteurella multocida]|nr:ATPase [Pasteurella multocida]